jgi:outer membrane biogenesis lipoprotein LolB
MRTLATVVVLAASALISGCATTGSDAARAPLDPLAEAQHAESLGAIVEYQGITSSREARGPRRASRPARATDP